MSLRFAIPVLILFLTSCGIPSLSRNPLEFFTFLRFFNRQSATTEHSLGGAVSGLFSGASITITNNNESVTLTSDGNFTFPTKLKSGTSYSVSFSVSNASTMSCSIASATGTIQTSDISNVSITCGWGTDYYEVGVSVTGITGSLTVQNNGSESKTITATGLHKFSTRIQTSSSYVVTISSQTAGSVCSFVDPTFTVGTIASANVTIFITCVTGYLSGGTIQSVAAVDLGATLISQNAYLRTMVGSYPINAGGAGPQSGINNGSATVARFFNPKGIASDGSYLYVADFDNDLIRKIDKTNGNTTTLAGGASGGGTVCPGTITTNCLDGVGTAARFNKPFSLTTDGTSLYVLEFSGNRLRKINLATAAVTTLAGSGNSAFADNANGILASFQNPHAITLYNGVLYVADRYNHRIRAVSPVTGAVTTFAGDGTPSFADLNGVAAQFSNPTGIVGLGGFLYVSDLGNERIRMISLAGANPVTTLAGNGTTASVDGFGTGAQFSGVFSIASDGTNLFVSEYNTYKIRHVRLSDAKVSTLLGGAVGYADNSGSNALMNRPAYLVSDGINIYTSEENNHAIRRIENSELIRYSFDSNSNDSIGTNHGLFVGTPTSVSDENGTANGAYEFDGATQYIASTSNVLFNGNPLTDNLTIAAWVFPSGGATDQFIFYNGLGGGNGYGVVMQGSTRNLYVSLGGVGSSGVTTRKLPLNRWSHVALTRNNTSWQIHINGVADAIAFNTNPISPAATFKVAEAGNGYYLRGKISDVRFFHGALDSNALQKLAVQVPSGLISYFPLNGNANDYGNYENHLTISGATTTTDRNGHANAAYNFNGGSFMEKLNPIGLPTGNSARTNCAWFRTTNSAGQYVLGYGTMVLSSGNGLVLTSAVTGLFGVMDDLTIFHEDFLNQWVHLCGVYDSTTAYIYEFGVLRASVNKSWTTATGPSLQVGRLINGTGNFFGDIDDVRIYDRVLSISEMKALAGHYPTQVSSWNATIASSSLKFYLMPEATTYAGGICSGGINCVSSWTDRSGSGYSVSQGLGLSQPYYIANAVNGSPAVRFVGTGLTPAFMSGTCQAALNTNTNTIFTVFREGLQAGNNGLFQNGAQNTGKLLYIIRNIGSNPVLFDLQSNGVKVESTTPYNVSSESVLLSLDYNGGAGTLYKNGSLSGSNSFGGSAFNCGGGNLDIGRYYYGGIYPADGGYFDGHIGDFLLYNQVLSTSDRNIVECYLSNKYNIPVGHSCP
jgi:hypothetical protein